MPRSGAGGATVSGAATRRLRRSITSSAEPQAPVTARSPRMMIAAFSWRSPPPYDAQPVHVVERDVRDHGHAAVPGMGGIEPPPSPTSTTARSMSDLGEPEERHRGQQLEFGRVAVTPGNAVGEREHLRGDAGERLGVHGLGRDLQPLAIRDQVRLGRLPNAIAGGPQGGIDVSARTLPFAVRAADQSATE
jgi:hypothetical protein